MVSLADIIETKKTETIRGVDYTVEGINAEKLGFLLFTFPELRLLFAGRGLESPVDNLFKMGPRIVASVIAAGVGETGKADAEQGAARLTLGEQAKLLTAIFDVTFPDGVGPFVERLRSTGLLEDDPDAAAGASGWGRVMNSHAASKPSPAAADSALPKS